MSFSYQSAYRTDRDTEWSWNKDMRYYNWDDLEFPTPLGMSEYVKLIKVRFIDDKRRSTVFRERHPTAAMQGKGVPIGKDGRGYLHLVTDGGHLVPFQPYRQADVTTAGTTNFDMNEIKVLAGTDTPSPQYGYHWGRIDYKLGLAEDFRPIPIFAFANDVTETVYTNEDKTLAGIVDEGLYGSIVLNTTKAKEEDKDKLNVHVDLLGKNRDIVPTTNSVITLDTSTLTDDIKIIDQKNDKITQ